MAIENDVSAGQGDVPGDPSGDRPGERDVVVHIGVPKTGTTALQSCLAASRERLAEHGWLYPGKRLNQVGSFRSPLGWPASEEMRVVDADRWSRLTRTVRRAQRPVVLSAENVSVATDEQAAAIVEALGGHRVRVVVTVRPLVSILPSAWQEDIKAGVSTPYADWLETVCSADAPIVELPFWIAHDHATVVERWASLVGAERTTVIVVDSARPTGVFEAFDDTLGLPIGTLDPGLVSHGNRSLTVAECELIRRINERMDSRDELTIRQRLVPPRAIWNMVDHRPPAPGEAKLGVPGWAIERIAPVASDAVERIAGVGCRVMGDLDLLRVRSTEGTGGQDDPATVSLPVDAAVLMVEWLLANWQLHAAGEGNVNLDEPPTG